MINEALGLPVGSDEDTDSLRQPLSVALIAKGLDDSGEIAYWIMCSPGLTGVEALGMFTWAAGQALAGA